MEDAQLVVKKPDVVYRTGAGDDEEKVAFLNRPDQNS